MTQPRVVLCSMWKNDLHRSLVDRAEHLLAKAEMWPNLRFVWVVGDSADDTARALAQLSSGYNVRIVDIGDTGIEGDGHASRLRRLSATANEYLNWVDDADYVLMHESDLVSPYDIVSRLVAHAQVGRCPIAAWPTLALDGHKLFYDIFCYRKDGVRFSNRPPYHACYVPDEPFTVDSFGSVFLFDAADAPYVHMRKRAVLDLCDGLRAHGRTLWVDPTLEVIQPYDLWQHVEITKECA